MFVGSTWKTGGSGDAIGILIVDLCAKGDFELAQIRKIIAYQMSDSDGHTSHIRISVSTNVASISADSEYWREIIPWCIVDAPQMDSETQVKATKIWEFTPISIRLLKIEVKNDGRYGKPTYIELRQLKAF